MNKEKWKGTTLLAPVPPVLVTCGNEEKPNVLTVAWTGIINSQPPKTYISVRKERYSYNLIKESGVFCINLPTEALIRAVDYCGMKSGRDEDKFAAVHITPQYLGGFACPMVAESPISLACRVTDVVPLGSHDMFLADIENVYVATDLLDEKGKLHLGRAKLISYIHGEYFAMGKRIGGFGCSIKKKDAPRNRPNPHKKAKK